MIEKIVKRRRMPLDPLSYILTTKLPPYSFSLYFDLSNFFFYDLLYVTYNLCKRLKTFSFILVFFALFLSYIISKQTVAKAILLCGSKTLVTINIVFLLSNHPNTYQTYFASKIRISYFRIKVCIQ